jgi:hypothetical protein
LVEWLIGLFVRCPEGRVPFSAGILADFDVPWPAADGTILHVLLEVSSALVDLQLNGSAAARAARLKSHDVGSTWEDQKQKISPQRAQRIAENRWRNSLPSSAPLRAVCGELLPL